MADEYSEPETEPVLILSETEEFEDVPRQPAESVGYETNTAEPTGTIKYRSVDPGKAAHSSAADPHTATHTGTASQSQPASANPNI